MFGNIASGYVKLNCWDFTKCGREPGGAKAQERGVCPASTDVAANGFHGGKNGGRICWAIEGTLCDGTVQGTFAQKISSCMGCEFFKKVKAEEPSIVYYFMLKSVACSSSEGRRL